MRNWRAGAVTGVMVLAGLSAACGGNDTAAEDTTVSLIEGVENAALSNPMVSEVSNSNALATLYRAFDRTIQRARLASERATAPEIRQMAQQMLDERARLTLDATAAAQRLGVDFQTPLDTLATTTPQSAMRESHEEAMEQLGGLTGASFDTTWVRTERRLTQESLDRLAAFNDPSMDSTVSRLVGEARTVLQRESSQLQQLLGGG